MPAAQTQQQWSPTAIWLATRIQRDGDFAKNIVRASDAEGFSRQDLAAAYNSLGCETTENDVWQINSGQRAYWRNAILLSDTSATAQLTAATPRAARQPSASIAADTAMSKAIADARAAGYAEGMACAKGVLNARAEMRAEMARRAAAVEAENEAGFAMLARVLGDRNAAVARLRGQENATPQNRAASVVNHNGAAMLTSGAAAGMSEEEGMQMLAKAVAERNAAVKAAAERG